jgi:hypothetical protein
MNIQSCKIGPEANRFWACVRLLRAIERRVCHAFVFTPAGAMASRSAVLSLAEAGISPQVGAPPADVLDPSFAPSERDGLLVIDVQIDFMPGGALEVPGGTEVIPIVNALVPRFKHVVLSQDWHPPKHSSFASQHDGKSPYDEMQMPYGAQTLWPDHCVQNTPGSAFHADLAIPAGARVCRKGYRRTSTRTARSSRTTESRGRGWRRTSRSWASRGSTSLGWRTTFACATRARTPPRGAA